MVCHDCKGQNHGYCANENPTGRRKQRPSWCDCQHRTDVTGEHETHQTDSTRK